MKFQGELNLMKEIFKIIIIITKIINNITINNIKNKIKIDIVNKILIKVIKIEEIVLTPRNKNIRIIIRALNIQITFNNYNKHKMINIK